MIESGLNVVQKEKKGSILANEFTAIWFYSVHKNYSITVTIPILFMVLPFTEV